MGRSLKIDALRREGSAGTSEFIRQFFFSLKIVILPIGQFVESCNISAYPLFTEKVAQLEMIDLRPMSSLYLAIAPSRPCCWFANASKPSVNVD